MRIYKDFPEAQNEIKRDLAELSIEVQPETMQDKYVGDNPDFLTKELHNYGYSVLNPDFTLISGVHDEWVKQEWEDRLVGGLNPGRAWRQRKDVWQEFLEHDGPKAKEVKKGLGRFSYTYSQRMGGNHIFKVIEELEKHPNSRQLWVPVWKTEDEDRRGDRRVPCSLGYWFVQREGELEMTYMMRSCDFATHYPNDVALASIMQKYVASKTGYEVGTFTHFVGSFHIYAKDVADVF
jgi:thymidylate synthase